MLLLEDQSTLPEEISEAHKLLDPQVSPSKDVDELLSTIFPLAILPNVVCVVVLCVRKRRIIRVFVLK